MPNVYDFPSPQPEGPQTLPEAPRPRRRVQLGQVDLPFLLLTLLLLAVGLVYICETLSDILQVGYFKLTHGKRIFKMAPIHHHFEKSGWSEVKVFAVFSGVSLLFALLTFLGVRGRYGL